MAGGTRSQARNKITVPRSIISKAQVQKQVISIDF
jgi:hypothetical protein